MIKGSLRLLRGGSWFRYDCDCAVSRRDYNYPSLRGSSIGFRIAIGGIV